MLLPRERRQRGRIVADTNKWHDSPCLLVLNAEQTKTRGYNLSISAPRNLCKVAAGASAQPDTNGSNLRNSDQLL